MRYFWPSLVFDQWRSSLPHDISALSGGSPILTGKDEQEAILEVGVRVRIARYGAQEVKAHFFEKTSRSEVALENFGLNLGQAERAKSVACDQMRGGGADTFAPVGTSDDYSKLCDTLLFGCDSQPNRSHAIGRALRYDRPSNTCLLAKALSMALKPLKAHFD